MSGTVNLYRGHIEFQKPSGINWTCSISHVLRSIGQYRSIAQYWNGQDFTVQHDPHGVSSPPQAISLEFPSFVDSPYKQQQRVWWPNPRLPAFGITPEISCMQSPPASSLCVLVNAVNGHSGIFPYSHKHNARRDRGKPRTWTELP